MTPTTGRERSRPLFWSQALERSLLDPVAYYLHMLDRLNQMEVRRGLPVATRTRAARWMKHRGAPYRRLESGFTPSRDLVVPGEYRTRLAAVRPADGPLLIDRSANESLRRRPTGFVHAVGRIARELIQIGRAGPCQANGARFFAE